MMQMYDVTLRDGNHALRHQLKSDFVTEYCKIADESQVWAVEVGHGNGLGASSYLVGKSFESDHNLLSAAKSELKKVKLAVHTIPGFATIKRDLIPAIECGVDVFRVATHATEANTSEKHIEFLANQGVIVHGVLMMSHMNTINGLIDQAELMHKYGATGIILMDSAGHFLPKDVQERVSAIKNKLPVDVGFHAHNNLGVAVSNAAEAKMAGATIVDGASMGLGAGAGNAQLENIIAVLNRQDEATEARELETFLAMSSLVERSYPSNLPRTSSSSTQSGMAGVFSGYAPQVKILAEELGISVGLLWAEMAKRKLVAGQESMIREIARDLMDL
jgi:4-hydroxy 2-oxovalerate aldolase